ncbi:hypothetical protein EJ110_NYTH56210 [Nymphaea thermarum]|nr:hypothetical protein EJ110_NYTH56210 [Nymphaea thermarum]
MDECSTAVADEMDPHCYGPPRGLSLGCRPPMVLANSGQQAIADQLAASGNNISDKEKVQQTLNRLGHDYHAFITALEVLPVLPYFNELQGQLLQHEMNMKRVIERTHQGNSQNVLTMNVKFGKSHENSNHGGHGVLPTPHNQENNVPQAEDQ